MSLLSTSAKIIKLGDGYSAGSGIDITNKVISVTSLGPAYSAGPNIDIQDYVISGKDWTDEIRAVSADANSAFNTWVQNDYTNNITYLSGEIDDKVDKSESGLFYPMEGNPSGFLTTVPNEYATKDFVSSGLNTKLDISSFSSVSGDFLTAHQSLEGYATEQWVENKGYITGVDLSNYYDKTQTSSKEELADAFNNVNVPSSVLDLSGFEYNSQNLISGYGGSAFAGQGGGAEYTGVAPIVVDNENDTIGLDTFTLSGGRNVDLIEDYDNNIVRIDIDLSGMSFDDYYKKTETSSKEEISNAFSELSNDYYPLTGNPSGFLTAHQSLTNYYQKNETSSRDELNTAIQYVSANAGKTYTGVSPIVVNNTTNEISADAWVLSGGNGISLVDDNINNITRIDVTAQGGDPEVQNLVRSSSATWDSVSAKLDTTAFSTVSGDFLTAHQDISYKLDTSAFEDVSGTFATNEALENTSGAITSLIPTDYYPDTNPSGFISEVPESYIQNSDLTIVDNKITEISGVELSAGTPVEFEYDDNEAISGINGSAVRYPLTTEIFLQEPLYSSQINGSSYIGIGKYTDITELWTGSNGTNTTAILSEPFYNFKYIMVIGNTDITATDTCTQVIDTDKYRIMSAWQQDLYFTACGQHKSNVGETNFLVGKLCGNSAICRTGYYIKNDGWGYSTSYRINGISGLIRLNNNEV